MRFPLLVTILALLAFIPAAFAAVSEADAVRLKLLIAKNLDELTKQFAQDGVTVKKDGEVTAKTAGSYIVAQYPDITIVNKDGAKFDVGKISLNAVPAETPRTWNMTMALPSPMINYNKDGKETGRITFGSQNMQGVYSEDLGMYTSGAGTIKDTVFTVPGAPDAIRIGMLTGTNSLTPKNDRLVDLTIDSTASGLVLPASLIAQIPFAAFSPTSAKLKSTISNFPLNEDKMLRQELLAAQTPEDRKAVRDRISALYQANETLFDIDDFTIAGDGYALNFAGTAQAEQGAKTGYIIDGVVKAAGLQALQGKLLLTPKNTDAEKQAAMKAVIFITAMQTYMEKGQGDNYTLTLKVDKAGTILVNGVDRTQDFAKMMQAAENRGKTAPAAPIVSP